MRKPKHNKFLSALAVLACLILLGGAGLLLVKVLPMQKPSRDVTMLSTDDIFSEAEAAVEPDREAAYQGGVVPAVEDPQPVTPPVIPDEPQPAGPDAAQELAARWLALMTPEEKVWQLFLVTPEDLTGYSLVTQAGAATQEAIGQKPVGGLVYFAANLEDREQAQLLLSGVQSMSRIPLFLAVDEEGGTVSRIGSNEALGGKKIDAMRTYGDQGDPAAVYAVGGDIAENLLGLGFNLDFAPVADVAAGKSAVIGSRSFGTDPERCAAMVRILTGSLLDHGVLPCLKHFPGYGAAVTDDHYGTSVLEKTREELEQCDFLPFAAGIEAGAPFVMVSHLSVPAVTGDNTPADLSFSIVSELLRNKLGFENVIITDSHQMASITDVYTPAQAAVMALQAGVDMILMPQSLSEAAQGVLDALGSGELTQERIDESVLRILSVKARCGLLTEPEEAEEP